MLVRNLMTTDVITIGPDASLKEAARRMLEAGVSGLPVTSEDGKLIGIITEADFVSAEADRRARRRAGLLRFLDRPGDVPSTERLVSDVMTTDLVVIEPDMDHAAAARLMQFEAVKRLPVVEEGKLVGLISRTDMLRAFTRPDPEIVEEIRDHVLREVLWVDPRRVSVTCVDGNVILRGQLETRSDATLTIDLVRRLDGVASVTDELTWEVDNTREDMTGVPPGIVPRPNW
jgi:CBS domain-containing protein